MESLPLMKPHICLQAKICSETVLRLQNQNHCKLDLETWTGWDSHLSYW